MLRVSFFAKPLCLDGAEEHSVLNVCSIKGFRFPEAFLIELNLLIRQRYQLPFLIFAHDVEYAHDNVITNSPVSIQADQLAFPR